MEYKLYAQGVLGHIKVIPFDKQSGVHHFLYYQLYAKWINQLPRNNGYLPCLYLVCDCWFLPIPTGISPLEQAVI